MAQVYLMLTGPHFDSRRCQHLTISMFVAIMSVRNMLLLYLFLFLFLLLYHFLYNFFIRNVLAAVGLNLKKDIPDPANLVLIIVQLLDDSTIRRSDFRELLIGFDISHFIKLADTISLLHIQLPHLALLDLLSEIWKVEPQECETGPLDLKE